MASTPLAEKSARWHQLRQRLHGQRNLRGVLCVMCAARVRCVGSATCMHLHLWRRMCVMRDQALAACRARHAVRWGGMGQGEAYFIQTARDMRQ
jgi:hypothetical protein